MASLVRQYVDHVGAIHKRAYNLGYMDGTFARKTDSVFLSVAIGYPMHPAPRAILLISLCPSVALMAVTKSIHGTLWGC
jgi:hypothetical protein